MIFHGFLREIGSANFFSAMKRCVLLLLLPVLGLCLLSACNGSQAVGTTETTAESVTIPSKNSGSRERLIAHAGGAAFGYRLTNSLEALDAAYANGFKVIELDFERTTDGKYVLLHDWDSMAKRMLFKAGQLSLAEFQSAESFADLTLMDLEQLFDWLRAHEDCYIVTDAKCGNAQFLPDLYALAGDLVTRFIPQAYSFEEYADAVALGYEAVILTLYKSGYTEEEVLTFAEANEPYAITIPKERLTSTLVSPLTDLGICTYAHTVNDLYIYEEWNASDGLYGIYTDYFCPIRWPYK